MARCLIFSLIGVALLFGVWFVLCLFLSDAILPTPMDVAMSLMHGWRIHLHNVSTTSIEAALGLLIASVASAVIVAVIGCFPSMEPVIYPPITMLKASPAIVFVPLFMVLVGSGMSCKILVSAMISFFPLVVGGIDGLRHVPQKFLMMTKGYGASRLGEFWHVKSRYAAAGFLTGLKTAAPLSIVGAIVGEYVAGGHPSGLGHFIMVQSAMFAMDNVFAGAVMATLLGIGFFAMSYLLSHVFLRHSHVDK